jgi:hypothetical protein
MFYKSIKKLKIWHAVSMYRHFIIEQIDYRSRLIESLFTVENESI